MEIKLVSIMPHQNPSNLIKIQVHWQLMILKHHLPIQAMLLQGCPAIKQLVMSTAILPLTSALLNMNTKP